MSEEVLPALHQDMAVLHSQVTTFNLELLLLTDQPLPIAQNSSKDSPWDLHLLEAYRVESWDNLWLGKSWLIEMV